MPQTIRLFISIRSLLRKTQFLFEQTTNNGGQNKNPNSYLMIALCFCWVAVATTAGSSWRSLQLRRIYIYVLNSLMK
jgi:hypothetical protein